jgi:hypothetical protein
VCDKVKKLHKAFGREEKRRMDLPLELKRRKFRMRFCRGCMIWGRIAIPPNYKV